MIAKTQKQNTPVARESDKNWIKATLMARGLTQREVADRLELHPSNVSHLLNANGETSLPNFLKLAGIFGVTIEELLRRLGYVLPEGERVRLFGTVQSDGSIKRGPAGKYVICGPVPDALDALTFELGSGLDQAILYVGKAVSAESCINSVCLVDDAAGPRIRVVRWAGSRTPGRYSLHPALGADAPVEDEVSLRVAQRALCMRF